MHQIFQQLMSVWSVCISVGKYEELALYGTSMLFNAITCKMS